MSTDLLNTSDVAALLQVTDETVRRWADAGQIRHIRLPSGHLRFRREDIDAIATPIEPTRNGAS